MKKKYIYIFAILFAAVLSMTGFKFTSNVATEETVYAISEDNYFYNTLKNTPAGSTVTVNNHLFFINFSGEENTLTNTHSLYGKTEYEIIEDTYNNSEYSVKNYFKTISGGKLNLNTNFVYNGSKGTPFTLSYDRGYFITGGGTTTKLIDAIYSTIQSSTSSLNSLTLDANGDSYIDAVTFMLTADPQNRTVAWSTPLWAHSASTPASYTVKGSDGKSARFYTYNLATVEVDDSIVPIRDSKGIKIGTSATFAHELGHVLGLPDYYIYDSQYSTTLSDNDTVPVGIWHVMANNAFQFPQHMLAVSKRDMGFISDTNIKEITENNTYSLYPASHFESGFSSTDTMAYVIRGQGAYSKQYFYIEYRKPDGLFDSKLNAGGLIVYRVDTNLDKWRNAGHVAVGNYAAPPYDIEVFKNTLSYDSSTVRYSYTTGDGTTRSYTDQDFLRIKFGRIEEVTSGGFMYQSGLTNKGLANAMTALTPTGGVSKMGNAVGATPETTNVTYKNCWNGYSVDVKWETADITYQVYSGTNQSTIKPANVSKVNTGIQIEVTGYDSLGRLQFTVNWDQLASPDTEVKESEFEDANLYNKLKEILSAKTGTVVTKLDASDFVGFTSLNLSSANITSLVGLEKFDLSTLRYINLMNNGLTNAKALASLADIISKNSSVYFNFNLNKLEPSSISSELKLNTKIIYGFQNYIGETDKTNYFFTTDAEQKILAYYFNSKDVVTVETESGYTEIYNTISAPQRYTFSVKFSDVALGENFVIDFYLIRVTIGSPTFERNTSFVPSVTIEGISETLLKVTTSAVSTRNEVQNYVVEYTISLKADASISRTFMGTFNVVDTTAPILTSEMADKVQSLAADAVFNLSSVRISISDNGEEVDYPFAQGMTNTNKKIVRYQIQKLNEKKWENVSEILTNVPFAKYRIKFQAVDGSGNTSEILYIEYQIEPDSVFTKEDFQDEKLYDSLMNFARKNNISCLYDRALIEFNLIDLSYSEITNASGLEKFSFASGAVVDFTGNNFTAKPNAISGVTLVLLFNNISDLTPTSGLVLGLQKTKAVFINENPNAEIDAHMCEDYSSFFDFTVDRKQDSASSGMSTFSLASTFEQYGTYTLQFTSKTDSGLSHKTEVTHAGIVIDKPTYRVEAGTTFQKSEVLLYSLNHSEFRVGAEGVPSGKLEISNFNVTYRVYEISTDNLVATLTQKVVVSDTQAPNIYLFGDTDIVVYVGEQYEEPGYSVLDSYDKVPKVNINGYVNTEEAGSYTLTYTATDASGNTSTAKVRKVRVIYYPLVGINLSFEQRNYFVGDRINLEVKPIVKDGKEGKCDPGIKYNLYINSKLVEVEDMSFVFSSVGDYAIEVKALADDGSGNIALIASDVYKITVRNLTFIERYGFYMLGGLGGFVVISIALYFIISSRRSRMY